MKCPYCRLDMDLAIDEALGQTYECPECGFSEDIKY